MGEKSFYPMYGIFSPTQGYMILLPNGVTFGFKKIFNIHDKRIIKCMPKGSGLTEGGQCWAEQILPWWQKKVLDADICVIPAFEKMNEDKIQRMKRNLFSIIFKTYKKLILFLEKNLIKNNQELNDHRI